ncbi:T9SS sorting signal type C domain-containing protein [Flavobacterium sp. AS60]|uniref:beta strand repeat-containing protein n=1 Tax=Flavobacterium anseongense TaxID=2910677 RepID=UPI001F1E337F|nr:T9SS sorting signal type C domain-containing protein [Flavobacterium sp. AS60]MCF6128201.1 T9SS sorting signal type C domain-containing protein [Flavobacterium sp. AS60]
MKTLLLNSVRKTKGFWTLLFFMLIFGLNDVIGQANFTASTGSWGTSGTWTLNSGTDADGVPDSNDNVTIPVGVTVTLDTNHSCNTLATSGVGATATITGAFTLSITSTITINKSNGNNNATFSIASGTTVTATQVVGGSGNNGTWSINLSGTLKLSAATVVSGNTITWTLNTGSTFDYSGTAQTVLGLTYSNLTLSNSGAKTVSGVTVNSVLSIEGTATASAAPTYGSSAKLQYNTSTARTISGTTNAGIEWVTSFGATGGVVIANTGKITMGVARTMTSGQSITVNNGATFDPGSFTHTINGGASLVVNGTLDFSNANGEIRSGTTGTSTLTLGSTGLIKTIDANGLGPVANASFSTQSGGAWTTTSISTNGTIEYYRTTDNTQIITDRDYNNLTITGTQTKTWTLAATRTVNGNINVSGGLTMSGTQTVNVAGNWVNSSGTFTKGTETFNFNGTAQSIGGSTSTTFNNVTLSNSGTKTFNIATTFGNNLTIASGVIANLSTFTHTDNGTLTLGGFGTASGSFGSTSSSATYKTDTFFTTATGIINVSIGSCGAISAVLSGANTICNGSSTNLTVAVTGGVSTYTVVYSGGTVNNYTSGSNISVSPTSTTGYSLTSVTDSYGCTASLSGTPTVTVNNPSVAPTSISGTTTICSPNSTTLTAVGGTLGTGANYQWGTGAVVGTSPLSGETASTLNISPGSSTTYWVRIESTTSPCTANTSGVTQLVTVNIPSVAPTSISGTTTICNGNSTTLTAVGGTLGTGANYQWGTGAVVGTSPLSGETASTLIVSPSGTTTYWVRIENTTGPCTATTSGVTQAVTVSNANTWTGGASSTSWTTSGNWSCGIVPTSVTDVTISTASFYPEISSNVTINSLTLDSGTTLKVNSTYDLTVTDVIDNDGTLTLENNANLLQTNDVSNTGSGATTVKRNSSALIRLDYTLWSSPVSGQGLYAFSPFTFGNRFYVYRTTTNLYNNADVGFSLTGLNGNGVNGTDSNNVQFATAKGYLIRVPWNHPTTAAVWNGTFTGVPNNGDITYTMTNGASGFRYNLVGNPYPSPISMSQFVSDNSTKITGTLYFWRETNNTSANNAYCTWAGGTFTSNGESQVFDPSGIIRTGQGFIVEAQASETVLSFNNGQRSSDNANQFFKNNSVVNRTDSVETNRFWLNLTNASGAFSQMAAGYMTDATDGVDIYDGKNINTGEVLLNSVLNNEEYTIQGKALPFTTADVIPLRYKITTAGDYTITLDHVDGLFTGGAQPIYLKDNLTSTIHDLNTGAYTFTSNAGTFSDRFEIVYTTQLGIENPVFTANNVIIYNQNNEFVVNSGNTIMGSVKVFDIRGRLLEEKKEINASQTTIGNGLTNQVLLVQITSEEGITVTKKVIR